MKDFYSPKLRMLLIDGLGGGRGGFKPEVHILNWSKWF